jgi:hypothetical protein
MLKSVFFSQFYLIHLGNSYLMHLQSCKEANVASLFCCTYIQARLLISNIFHMETKQQNLFLTCN